MDFQNLKCVTYFPTHVCIDAYTMRAAREAESPYMRLLDRVFGRETDWGIGKRIN